MEVLGPTASSCPQPSSSMQNIPPPNSIQWTLELVKQRIKTGVEISPEVVDIGGGVIVKYCRRPLHQEAATTKYVARCFAQTDVIRVPKIYAVFSDGPYGDSYLVEEKLPGIPLIQLLPHLDDATRYTLAHELKAVCRELKRLDDKGSMGNVGTPGKFTRSLYGSPADPEDLLNTPEEFIRCIPNALNKYAPGVSGIPTICGVFDFSRSPVFSHGDLVPENILVHNGHISGIIDWAHGGWYPYFWNDFIGRWRNDLPQFRDGRWAEMVGIMTESFSKEVEVFLCLYELGQHNL
ncbi:kinase-like domain-containing protein [Favolaschia claudopus]|uniref:Kinase-like domain-containing protein n=1 Tax=Favolaschia claudopus TaxID=2862362 RepID=A0AAW0DFM4_9AGAR